MTMYWSMDSDTTFVCLEAVWNSEVFDGDFVLCKNDRKDLYVQRKIFIINAIDQGISATSKTLAVNNVPISVTLIARSPDADNVLRKAITSFTITYGLTKSGKTPKLLTRDSTGSPKVSSRGLIPHKIACTKNIWWGKYKFFATLRSYVLASFQQITFKFGSILI